MSYNFIVLLLTFSIMSYSQSRARDFGIQIGVLPTGKNNAITDVGNVRVGQVTLHEGQDLRTGVTVIIPDTGNLFQSKIPAAIHVGNGFGKLAGSTPSPGVG